MGGWGFSTGAIVTLTKLGPLVVDALLMDNLKTYHDNTLAKSKTSGDEQERRDGQMVEEALINACRVYLQWDQVCTGKLPGSSASLSARLLCGYVDVVHQFLCVVYRILPTRLTVYISVSLVSLLLPARHNVFASATASSIVVLNTHDCFNGIFTVAPIATSRLLLVYLHDCV